MTSSLRGHNPDGPRWDYDRREFKNHHPFVEPGLVSIIVVAHRRPNLTAKCIESTIQGLESYDGEVEWVFIENGNDRQNYEFFQGLDLERKVVVRHDNFGINHAINQGWALSRGEFCMVHENDWFNKNPSFNFMQTSVDIMNDDSDVGIVQLRSVFDPHENWGFRKPHFNPWSCRIDELEEAGVDILPGKTKRGHEFIKCRFGNGFNNNPCLIRKKLFLQCGFMNEPPIGTDPRHDETHYQKRVDKTNWYTAHVRDDVYFHVGGSIREHFLNTGRLR